MQSLQIVSPEVHACVILPTTAVENEATSAMGITIIERRPMNKALSLAVFAGGVILLGFGIDAYNSASSDISRLFSGAATDKSIWMIAGGIAAIVFGIVGVLRSSKTS